MSRKVTIHHIEFNSKTKAQEYAKEILNKYSYNDILNDTDFEFMKSYFKHFHYEWERKNGVGIELIFIKKSNWGNNEFWIQRKDGSTTDISYILKKIEKPDYKYWLELAFRNVISEDILLFKSEIFRDKKYIICEITNEKLTQDEVDIDHYGTPFKSIFDEFVALKELQIDTSMFIESQDQQVIPQLIDSNLREEFRLYHQQICKLRAISKYANRGILNRK